MGAGSGRPQQSSNSPRTQNKRKPGAAAPAGGFKKPKNKNFTRKK